MLEYGGSVTGSPLAAECAVQLERAQTVFNIPTVNRSTLYVFSARNTRQAEIYLSPDITNAGILAESLTRLLGWEVAVELLGDPPRRSWIAVRRNVWERDVEMAASVVIITWLHHNGHIIH